MPALHTQIIDESPRVIILGDYDEFSAKVEDLFGVYEIETLKITLAQLPHLDVKSLSVKSIYRIIWWVDFSNIKTLETITKFLTEVSPEISVMIIGVLPEKYILDSEMAFEQKNVNFENLINNFPQAQFFFIRDYLEGNYLPEIIKTSLSGHKKQVLFDPEEDIYLTNLSGVIDNLKLIFFKPHQPQKILIQGKNVLSTDHLVYCLDLFQTYYSSTLELLAVKGRRVFPDIGDFLKVKITCEIRPILDKLVREKQNWEKKLNIPSPSLFNDVKRKDDSLELIKTIDQRLLKPQKQALKTSIEERQVDEKIIIDKTTIHQSKDQEKTKEEVIEIEEEKIEGELSRLFHQKRSKINEERIDKKVKIVKKISEKSKKNKVMFFGGVGVMILGGVTLALWLILEMTFFFAKKELVGYFEKNSPQTAQDFSPGVWAGFLNKQVGIYNGVASDLITEKTVVDQLINGFVELQSLQKYLQEKTANYGLGVVGVGETNKEFPQEIVDLSSKITEKISLIEESIFYLYPNENKTENETQQRWIDYLEKTKENLSLTQQLPGFFSSLFGGEGKKTYLVLLQNNLEIRPTGGFIQDFLLLTFDKGMLIDTQTFNTQEVDSLLPGLVAPPAELQKYLGEKNWFMRDSNWDPDFPTTAQRAAWFVKEALKKQVDGVLAMNFYVAQDLIEALDTIEISDHQETLTKNNLFERVEFHSDAEFVQNAAQNKDYTHLVFSQLFKRIKTASPEEMNKIIGAFYQSLESKDLLISLFDQKNQEILQQLGWNGEVISPMCPQRFPQTNCFVEQTYQVETNIGLNKVNGYIERKIEERIELGEKNIKHIRTVVFSNKAKSDGWPLGAYKLYLRFISGKNTQAKEVLVNGKKIDGGLASVYNEKDKKVVGFPLEVPKDSVVTVQYTYETGKVLDEPFSFLFFDQKQPGIEVENRRTTIYFPGKKATLIAPQGELFGDTLEFISPENTHSFVGVSLQNK